MPSGTILVVDDMARNRSLLEAVLSHEATLCFKPRTG